MKTNEITAGLRSLAQTGSQHRRTVCRLIVSYLEDRVYGSERCRP